MNIPASAQAEPPDTPRDIRRFILLGLLYGVAFLIGVALLIRLLGLPVE